MPEIEKTYKELSKKHKLPDFSMLDREFEISLIENDKFLLREIIVRMTDKIDYYAMLINNVLHPDNGTLAPLHECKSFDDTQKDILFVLYQKLMLNHRKGLLALLKAQEKGQAEFISGFSKEWEVSKSQLESMLEVMRDSWNEKTNIREELRYFG